MAFNKAPFNDFGKKNYTSPNSVEFTTGLKIQFGDFFSNFNLRITLLGGGRGIDLEDIQIFKN
jgi:hypothetical protein